MLLYLFNSTGKCDRTLMLSLVTQILFELEIDTNVPHLEIFFKLMI